MVRELRKLELIRSFNLKSDSFRLRNTDITIHRDHDPDTDCQGYTSLKDIIVHSPPPNAAAPLEANVFDSSNISIRNELVKHAASAYVQSAILTTRDPNCLAGFFENIKNKIVCWQVRVRKPLHACFGPIFRFLGYTMNGIARVWRGRVAIR